MTNKEFIDGKITNYGLDKFVIDRQSQAMGDYWVEFKSIDDDDTDAYNFAKLLIEGDVMSINITKKQSMIVRFF